MSKDFKLNYGDLEFYGGDPVFVEDDNLLVQDIGKIILTEKGSEFHPQYGSDLYSLIGRYEDKEIIDTISKKAIISALHYYANIQNRQSIVQEQTPDEILLKINKIYISKINATSYNVQLEIINGAGVTIPIEIPAGV